MLTTSTIEQIIEVLQKTKAFYMGGDSIEKAYNLACNQVRKRENVAYQTIADGCVRRLGFVGNGATREFHKVLFKWLKGDKKDLKHLLLSKADKSSSRIVIDFFDDNVNSRKINQPKVDEITAEDQEMEVISFRLPRKIAQQLKLLADTKGCSPSELISKTMTGFIDAQLHDLLAKIIKDLSDEDRQKLLRGH